MSLRIQHNVEAYNAHRNLSMSSAALSKSMERLASGFPPDADPRHPDGARHDHLASPLDKGA